MGLQELNISGLWAGKQAAKGVAAAAFDQRFKNPAGGIRTARDEGSENYSDLSKFGDAVDWINSVLGNGAPALHCTPEELAWLLYIFHGGETTAPIVGPPAKTNHLFEPLAGSGFWTSWFKRLGLTNVTREQFQDVKIAQLALAGSTGDKALKVSPTLLVLDPGINKAADPVAALPAKKTFLYSEGTGRWEVDGVVFEGHAGFQLTLNEDLQPVYGDATTPHDLIQGNATVGIQVNCYFDDDGKAQFNKQLYGDPAPAADARPLDTLPGLGSYEFELRAKDDVGDETGDVFKLSVPGVKWDLPESPEQNPDGGAAELQLTGSMRRVPGGGVDPYNIEVACDAAAFA